VRRIVSIYCAVKDRKGLNGDSLVYASWRGASQRIRVHSIGDRRSRTFFCKYLYCITLPHRCAQLWREIQARIFDLTDTQQILPLWMVDETHNLPSEFFRDLPAFLNFAFDSRDLFTIWLVGHPSLPHTLQRVSYAALAGRVQVRVQLKPVLERERFAQFMQNSFKSAGINTTLLTNFGLQLVRQSAKECRVRPTASCVMS
jgi:hypothetical protein